MSVEVWMNGGWNYATGEPETFATLQDAAEAWADRHDSNGLRRINGVFFPGWGDMEDDSYAIVTEDDGWTKAEVLRMARGAA